MTLRPASTGESAAPRFPHLEARFGPLTPMDSGMQSRVYATHDGQAVVKVFRNHQGHHRLEADNMRRAGMGQWVVDAVEADGVEALILRRFPGRPLRTADIPAALPELRRIVGSLHQETRGRVDLRRVQERLRRFRSALAAYPLEDLFEAVELPLERGELDQPAAFCHLDLWHDNILVAPHDGSVLVIDWTKAAWDDPLRDLALLKTGTLDLLGADESLQAALSFLPAADTGTLRRYRAYLALTTLHDLYWFLMNEPYEFEGERARKVPRARHALARLPR
ncbi:aminoglycoside phosphotransferase family protein [Deinococcus deserti]|uniref:Putative choline kinase n=1 Tax=Deinococcus deserti (strain DSM 17065 / CIP 109153 / LMG 22923 / VCD115) TaxID=546414 RepID=C1CV81_DEIDV|nr:aminoglycoside phosphotransferase family protein [Deinococcus deserti]ACO46098.1 putative choline kinase [Deinococcus deserti VCD115]